MRLTFPLKNTPLTLFIFVVFFFSGGSCSRWNIGDIGPTVSVTRIINDATHLEISQKFDVILKQDTTAPEFYIIEYPEKLIPNIVLFIYFVNHRFFQFFLPENHFHFYKQ